MAITLNGTTGITTPDVTSSGSLNIDAIAPDNSLVVDSSGNVGIGTSSPSVPVSGVGLHLSDTSANTGIRFQDTAFANKDFTIRLDATDNALAIYHQNSASEKMRIDSAGRVTMPYQPSFFVGRSGNFGFTGTNQTEPMVFNLVHRNTGSHYNSSTGIFTAPVSGNYCFASGGYTSVNLSQMWFIVNGVRTETYAMFDSTEATQSGSGIVYLTAGDTLGIHYYVNTGSVTLYQNTNHTFFRGFLVG